MSQFLDAESKPQTPIFKWTINYGLIYGLFAIVLTLGLYLANLSYESWAALIAYALILGVSVFVISKRKSENGGFIELKEAFLSSFYVLLIGGIISIAYQFIHINFVDTDFIETLIEIQKQKLVESGLSESQVRAGIESSKMFMTPMFILISGFIGSVAIAALVSIIVAAVMQKKRKF